MTAHLTQVDPAAFDRALDALRILCVLPTLNPYGGVVSAVNAMNILADRGHHVTLVSLSKIGADRVHPRMEPLYFDMETPLPEGLAATHDVLIATSWETALLIADLGNHNTSAATFYYVQDIEADLFPPSAVEERAKALHTYRLIDNKIVKTRHLQERLAENGHNSMRIPPGMDLDIFYPRAGPPSMRAPGVLAMARPDMLSDHRGFKVLVEVYDQLGKRRPDLRLGVFGPPSLPAHYSWTNHGRVTPAELPELYSSYPVFVDVSRVHGFGRTGVEAMACGTACVLSDSGGISEYAVHDENALIVPVAEVGATVDAIELLLDTPQTADLLAGNAIDTVAGYSDYAAAAALEDVLQSGLARVSEASAAD